MLGYCTAFAPELDEHERIVDAPTSEQKSTRPYNERRPFVEADKPKDQALHDLGKPGSYEQHETAQANGHQEQEPAALTLEDVQKRAVATGVAKSRQEWQFFNAETFVAVVPDEKLQGDQKRLVSLNDEITD